MHLFERKEFFGYRALNIIDWGKNPKFFICLDSLSYKQFSQISMLKAVTIYGVMMARFYGTLMIEKCLTPKNSNE